MADVADLSRDPQNLTGLQGLKPLLKEIATARLKSGPPEETGTACRAPTNCGAALRTSG